MKYLHFLLLFISHSLIGQQLVLKNIPPTTDASFRGLSVVDDHVAWVSGSKGWVGLTTNGGSQWDLKQVKGYERCDFRSLYAFDGNKAIIANAGTPAYILLTTDGGVSWAQVYKNDDSAAFFDGIDFWNKDNGIIYGDPIQKKMLLLTTKDGGASWQEKPDACRPELAEGEASFAASGTTIKCLNKKKVIIATGGTVSRLLISEDKGSTWRSVHMPILQGKSTTGIFSLACKDDKTMIVTGGDYKNDTLKKDHVFYSTNGGKTWTAPTKPTRGYRECVSYIKDKKVLALGPSGMDVSFNDGISWKPLSDETQFHAVKKSREGNLVIFAGSRGKISVLPRGKI